MASSHKHKKNLGNAKAEKTNQHEIAREGRPGARETCTEMKEGVHLQKTQVHYPERERETISATEKALTLWMFIDDAEKSLQTEHQGRAALSSGEGRQGAPWLSVTLGFIKDVQACVCHGSKPHKGQTDRAQPCSHLLGAGGWGGGGWKLPPVLKNSLVSNCSELCGGL